MVKSIFLFPGQGAQYPGMGLDLIKQDAAKKVFDCASGITGRDIIPLIDSDAETLKRTDVAQVAISAVSLGALAYLAELGITPCACAGFSLGEYPAFVCARVIGLEDCFRLMDARGRAMQKAADKLAASGGEEKAGMAAVLGLPAEKVEHCLAEWKIPDLYAANINAPAQVVVSGSAGALARAETCFKEAGARRFIRLQVAGPFHSPLMKEAADECAALLQEVRCADPAIALFSNVSGKQLASGAEAKALALRQIVEGVRWTDEERAMETLGADAVVEVGPGRVLQGLWSDAGSAVPAYGAGTLAEIDQLKGILI
ncbi:MAG: ACP S-malonyltransferase [Treponema sp.]|jgi:[acyl-carrier-protein] S-malonyltransferase|nr:ACP S-malonyltransferase [Treponema sp.]